MSDGDDKLDAKRYASHLSGKSCGLETAAVYARKEAERAFGEGNDVVAHALRKLSQQIMAEVKTVDETLELHRKNNGVM